jgi:hypothetical protein
VALRGLAGLLLGMHTSGREGRSISALTVFRNWGPDLKQTRGAIETWQEYAKTELASVANGWEAVQWHVAVDAFLFAPAYTVAVLLFLLWVKGKVKEWASPRGESTPDALKNSLEQAGLDEERSLASYRHTVRIGIGAILVAFLADEIENLCNLLLVGLGWHGHAQGFGFGFFAWVLFFAAWLKWLAIVVAVGVVLLSAFVMIAYGTLAPTGGWKALLRRLWVLRLHVLLVLFAAVALSLHEQIADLVRRWTPAVMLATLITVALVAGLVWLSARRLLVHGAWQSDRSKEEERRLEVFIAFAAGAIGVVQLILHVLSNSRFDPGFGPYDPGFGLVIPAVILLALALAGWRLPDPMAAGATPGTAGAGAPVSPGEAHPVLPRLLAAIVLVGFALGVLDASFAYAVYVHELDAWPLVIVGAVFAALVARRFIFRVGEPLLWGALGGIVGIAVFLKWNGGELDPPVLVVVALLLVPAAWAMYGALGRVPEAHKHLSRPVLVAIAVALAAMVGWMIGDPWTIGEYLGVVGVLFAFLFAAVFVAAALTWLAPGLPVPRVLRLAGIGTFPVLALLVFWFVAASRFDLGGYHDARVEAAQAPAVGVHLDEAFACWLRKNGLPGSDDCRAEGGVPSEAEATGAIPLVLVSGSGGGIRAAYWTALVLDCAFERERPDGCMNSAPSADFKRSNRLFAASGISGTSLGLAAYGAYLTEKVDEGPEIGWPHRALGVDALSASGAWWLFVELPRALLRFDVPRDRAAVLEQGWERRWNNGQLGRGLLELWHTRQEAPLLLLNATSVEDGCRFEASALDGNVERVVEPLAGEPDDFAQAKAKFAGCRSMEPFADTAPGTSTNPAPLERTRVSPESVLPGTRDLVDYLCRKRLDVPLSTAALLSARFPFVNPSGRIERRCETKDFRRPVAYVVDGGYLDTSGASPLSEIMQSLAPMIDDWNREHAPRCIVPTLIQIDNGFATGAGGGGGRPGELLIPPKTLAAVRGGRAAESRAGAAIQFSTAPSSRGRDVNRFAHFVNAVHAGPHAPLGWAQSEFSEDELEAQLEKPQNVQAFAEVNRWLQRGALRCST